MDSYNSYPHLMNIENHLDQVVAGFEALPVSHGRLNLRPVEIYVLLASVLFHDLGRAHKGDHAVISEGIIVNKYANLGIPSLELARCIAQISLGHSPPESWTPGTLYDVVIDPYGEVRQRSLLALLTLGDHMDTAYNRVSPPYLKSSLELKSIGLFRRVVRGVYADCESQMVRVVLADMNPWKENNGKKKKGATTRKAKKSRYCSSYEFVDLDNGKGKKIRKGFDFGKALIKEIKLHNLREHLVKLKELYNNVKSDLAERNKADYRVNLKWIPTLLSEGEDDNLNGEINKVRAKMTQWFQKGGLLKPSKIQHLAIWHLLEHNVTATWSPRGYSKQLFRKLGFFDWCVVMGLLHTELHLENKANDTEIWPHSSLLAILMHDTSENYESLETIRNDLAVLGVPLQGWLLEHREHLYNHYGLETYEPIFDHHFLKRIVEAMWKMSVGIFGCSRFTYEELASQAREPNVTRVRCAVQKTCHRGTMRVI